MVDTRSKALKQGDKGKCRVVENLPIGQDNPPTLSSGQNSVDCPSIPQFVTTEQLGEALKQVQEAVIQDACEKMKTLEHQVGPLQGFEYEPTPGYTPPYQLNGNHSLQAEPSHARRMIEAKQALQRFR